MKATETQNRFTFVVHRDVPEMELRAGDVMTWEPGAPEPLLVHREIPLDVPRLAALVTLGALEPIRPERQGLFVALLRQYGVHDAAQLPLWTRRTRGHLALVEEMPPRPASASKRGAP